MDSPKIIFNETIKVDIKISEEWLDWAKETYIPLVMDSGHFESFQINRIIQNDSDGGVTFAIQFTAADMASVHQYHIQSLQKVQSLLMEKYKDKYVIFRTLMEIVV